MWRNALLEEFDFLLNWQMLSFASTYWTKPQKFQFVSALSCLPAVGPNLAKNYPLGYFLVMQILNIFNWISCYKTKHLLYVFYGFQKLCFWTVKLSFDVDILVWQLFGQLFLKIGQIFCSIFLSHCLSVLSQLTLCKDKLKPTWQSRGRVFNFGGGRVSVKQSLAY